MVDIYRNKNGYINITNGKRIISVGSVEDSKMENFKELVEDIYLLGYQDGGSHMDREWIKFTNQFTEKTI